MSAALLRQPGGFEGLGLASEEEPPSGIPRRGIVVFASPSSRVLAGLVSASNHAPHHHPAGHCASGRGDKRPSAGSDHYEKDRERREDSTKPHVRVIHRFSLQDLETRLGAASSARIRSAHRSCPRLQRRGRSSVKGSRTKDRRVGDGASRDLMSALLRQPGGFEGLSLGVELRDPRDLAVDHRVEGGEAATYRNAASGTPLPLPRPVSLTIASIAPEPRSVSRSTL
jgi:hypothetical protein